jgi:pimeloyl-ACP methyl ester carboxylesterase
MPPTAIQQSAEPAPTEPSGEPFGELPGESRRVSQLRPQHQTAPGWIGAVGAISLSTGLMAAVVAMVAPILPPRNGVLTGVVLLGLALGWALLAVLTVRLTDQPQRWAVVPALFMTVAGLVSMTAPAGLQAVFGFLWPPTLLVLVLWMILRVRRQLHSRGVRWLLYPIVAVLAVAAIGGGYETVREALDAHAYPPPGQLVDVGGHQLHLHCIGTGSPTVVLEPGLAGSSSDMAWIAPTVARDTRVCVYDRAGRGWSDPVDGPQDGVHIAADLHTLLTEAHIDGPYVLAGHSFGGLYVMSFAAQFPDEVAGLVLLDSTAPQPGPARPMTTEAPTVLDRVIAVAPTVAHLGVGRVLAQISYDSLPPRALAEARANASTSRHLASYLKEYLVEAPASIQEASALTDFGAKPLLVLTADTGHDATWRADQNHLATLSTNALHRIAPDTTHVSMIDDQMDSAAASQAVRDVVSSIRRHQSLPSR